MKEKKQKFDLWVYPSTVDTIGRYLDKSGCHSKSDFIEKAILFYAGFLAAHTYQDYIPNVVISRAREILQELESADGRTYQAAAPAQEDDQISMLDLRSQQVAAALERINVETLTPIEAMNELYKLKKMLN